MKRPILIIIFFIFVCQIALTQNLNLHFGTNLLNEVHASLNVKIAKNKNLVVECGYVYPIADQMFWEISGIRFSINFGKIRIQEGLMYRLKYLWNINESELFLHNISIEYSELRSGTYISDPGRSGGPDNMYYAIFKEEYNNFSIIYGRHQVFFKNRLDFFVETGFMLKFVTRYYSIKGTYRTKKPSNEIEEMIRPTPTIRIGVNVRIF